MNRKTEEHIAFLRLEAGREKNTSWTKSGKIRRTAQQRKNCNAYLAKYLETLDQIAKRYSEKGEM